MPLHCTGASRGGVATCESWKGPPLRWFMVLLLFYGCFHFLTEASPAHLCAHRSPPKYEGGAGLGWRAGHPGNSISGRGHQRVPLRSSVSLWVAVLGPVSPAQLCLSCACTLAGMPHGWWQR